MGHFGCFGHGLSNFVEDLKYFRELLVSKYDVPKLPYNKSSNILIFRKKGNRALVNVEEIRNVLMTEFLVQPLILEPSRLSLEEQIKLFAHACIIIGPPGGMTVATIPFMKENSTLFISPFFVTGEKGVRVSTYEYDRVFSNFKRYTNTVILPAKFDKGNNTALVDDWFFLKQEFKRAY
jgi:hypothetical protein